jgi:hypothetical protein
MTEIPKSDDVLANVSDDLMAKLAASLRDCPKCNARAGVPCGGREAFDFIHPDRLAPSTEVRDGARVVDAVKDLEEENATLRRIDQRAFRNRGLEPLRSSDEPPKTMEGGV